MNVRIATPGEDQVLDPRHALVLYGDSSGRTLVTVHEVRRDMQTRTLGPGRLLSEEELGALLRPAGNTTGRHALPPRSLCWDDGLLAWWVPAHRRAIFWQTRDPEWDREMNAREVAHPPLVFVARTRRLSVFALAENEHPAASTGLRPAPYFNLYDDGAMCAGNARLPGRAMPAETALWERAFWETRFTHTNRARLTTWPGGHDALWRHCADTETFPAEALLPAYCTLAAALA